MRIFCPNCGSDNDGVAGSRVTCRACTASFEVPRDSGAAQSPAAFGGIPVQPLERAPSAVQQVSAAPVQPPPNVWRPDGPGVFVQPSAGGETNPLAIVSLVSSLVGCVCGLGSLIGIVCGFIALSQVNASNGAQKGRELAIGGIAVGFLGCFMSTAYAIWALVGRGIH